MKNNPNLNKNLSLKRIGVWLILVLVIVGIPASTLYFGLVIFESKKTNETLKQTKGKIDFDFSKARQLNDTESFWASLFKSLVTKKYNKTLFNSFAHTRKYYDNCFDYICWDKQGNTIENTISTDLFTGDLKLFAKSVNLLYNTNFRAIPQKTMDPMAINAHKLFGSQLILKDLLNCYKLEKPTLILTDIHGQKPFIWTYAGIDYGVIFLIKKSWLQKNIVIEKFITEKNKEQSLYSLNLIVNNQIQFNHDNHLKKSLNKIIGVKELPINIIKSPNSYIFPKLIDNNIIITATMQKAKSTSLSYISPKFITVIFILILLPIYYISFQTIVFQKPPKVFISWKLAFLFILANAFPLSVVLFIGYDFIVQKQFSELDEAYHKGLKYLQTFDEGIASEKAKKVAKINKAIKKLLPILKKDQLSTRSFYKFITEIFERKTYTNDTRIALVASSSQLLANMGGIYKGKHHIPFDPEIEKNPPKEATRDFYFAIAKYFSAILNKQPVDIKISTKIELAVETIVQKKLPIFSQELLTSQKKISKFSFGETGFASYLDMLSTSRNGFIDYLLLIMWKKSYLQASYIKSQIQHLNRNPSNFKFYAFEKLENRSFPESWPINENIKQFASTLTVKPSDGRHIIQINNKNYLILGMRGTGLNFFNLVCLYPTIKIENLVSSQKKQLLIAGILSLLLSVSFGLLLSHSILSPVNALTMSTEAIEQGRFTHRISHIGNNEFGKMSVIFNDIMVDLEELKIASAIQENLLPTESIYTGNFSLFGSSIPMGELGGDYYDYFITEENHFSMLIGDVAGHGVGAALIMAMAKAGIIQLEEYLLKPAKIIQELDQLILASKTKQQKKIMTFQYLSINSLTGVTTFSNAGGCSPIYYSHDTNSVKEITLKGPVLGAFKNSQFTEININFKLGDALVLYTDGIVETRNSEGIEFSFEQMQKTVIDCYDLDAKVYYEKIKQKYLKHLGNNSPQDDLTIMILVYTGDKHHV